MSRKDESQKSFQARRAFFEEAIKKVEGIVGGHNFEDRDYAEFPPKALSLLAKAVIKQGTNDRVPGSRSLQQSVAGRPGSQIQISQTQDSRAEPLPLVVP